ncbi:hypothetical protein EPO17_02475 [Patescibacteria group bacterium]|nr:MAG: hypothetical protein EPO17_02475 [Patescibacteria group bacterium]
MNIEHNHLFYIANLGSEVSRYLDYFAKKDLLEAERSWQRIEKIINSLQSLPLTESARLEVSALVTFIKKPDQRGVSILEVKRQCSEYFMPFALRMMAMA